MSNNSQMITNILERMASNKEEFSVLENDKLTYEDASYNQKENPNSKNFAYSITSQLSGEVIFIELLKPGEPEDYIGQTRIEDKYKKLLNIIQAKKDKKTINQKKFKILLVIEYSPITMNILDHHINRKITCEGGNGDIELLIYDKNKGIFSLDQWKVSSSLMNNGSKKES